MLTLLDSLVPQMVDQLVAVLARYDTLLREQVVEVPKISCPPRFSRTVLRTLQMAEQLVEVPTVLSCAMLQQWNGERIVPRRGESGFLQGLSPGHGSQTELHTACCGAERCSSSSRLSSQSWFSPRTGFAAHSGADRRYSLSHVPWSRSSWFSL